MTISKSEKTGEWTLSQQPSKAFLCTAADSAVIIWCGRQVTKRYVSEMDTREPVEDSAQRAMARCAMEELGKTKTGSITLWLEEQRERRRQEEAAEKEALKIHQQCEKEFEIVHKIEAEKEKIARETKKQTERRLRREAEEAAIAAEENKKKEQETRERQRLEALMDPERDPGTPLMLDKVPTV